MNAPIERMRKILALARRGVDGEKTTAEAMLGRLMAKYELTLADLEDQAAVRTRYWFKCKNEIERALLRQIVSCVLGDTRVALWSRRGSSERAAELSPLEFAEVDVRFQACKPALRAELRKAEARTLTAFIHTNRLGVDAKSDDEGTMMDSDELAAVLGMMQGMKPIRFHRQISNNPSAPDVGGRKSGDA
jgi:hypothetical protein